MSGMAYKKNLEVLNFDEEEQTVIDTSPQAILSPMYHFFHSPYYFKTLVQVLFSFFKGVRMRMIESRDKDRIQYADSLYQRIRLHLINNLKS